MREPWTSDRDTNLDLARRLIEQQFPGFTGATLTPFGEGWDNTAYLLDGRLVFRFPRREIAANLLEREARILRALAQLLPVQVSVPAFISRPTEEFPWVFTGYPLISGLAADHVPLRQTDRIALAKPLAKCLRALHDTPLDAAMRSWIPGDDLRRADVPCRGPRLLEVLKRIRTIASTAQVEKSASFIGSFMIPGVPRPSPPECLTHGDLYVRHLVLDGDRKLTGILDWGDVHIGNPAIDLSIVFSFLTPAARIAFWKAYGSVEDSVLELARFRAIHYGALLLEFGNATNDTAIKNAGSVALEYANQ